ncbi:uncharacterized protein [Spinacia oleracea]|uniref:F-box domain-containing protein n=1 Tax=Spinacia oleracea TaxID=3562 RepID=A0ABM3QLZ5_SPIOL|nr:uncharacterized protein LOC110783275 [Spinacia oleracea]
MASDQEEDDFLGFSDDEGDGINSDSDSEKGDDAADLVQASESTAADFGDIGFNEDVPNSTEYVQQVPEVEGEGQQQTTNFQELPEHIVHHILSFVPIKDAGRTCILTKDWETLCISYNICPSLHYDHNSFASLLLLSAKTGQEPELCEIRDKFMDFAENHLLTIQHNSQPVLKLTLDVVVVSDDEFSSVDRLIDLVGKIKAEELYVSVQTKDSHWYDDIFDAVAPGGVCYEFPYTTVLASNNKLQSLSIEWCKLINNNNVGMFSSLQHLKLLQVIVDDEALSNLSSCCPEIQVIHFEYCAFLFESLKLSIFPNLKRATIEGTDYSLLDNPLKNLPSFDFRNIGSKLVITPSACSNIRDLKLSCSVNEPNLFEDLTMAFPLIEKVDLKDVQGVNRIQAANIHLKSLSLLSNYSLKTIYVDCPNLCDFDFIGNGVEEVDYVQDECEARHISQRRLHLEVPILCRLDKEISTAFIDSLIWNTCPTILSTYGYCYALIKYLCEKLADKKSGDEECCCKGNLCKKYWWHNIKDFEIKHEYMDMKKKLTSLPELCKDFQQQRQGSYIKFKWCSF